MVLFDAGESKTDGRMCKKDATREKEDQLLSQHDRMFPITAESTQQEQAGASYSVLCIFPVNHNYKNT